MDTVLRVIFWSLCLLGYTKWVINRKRNVEFAFRQELGFSVVTSYAVLIAVRPIAYRIAQFVNGEQIIQELITAVGMIAAYTLIRFVAARIFKDCFVKWMYYLVSVTVLINVLAYIVLGNVSREIYFGIYVCVFLFSALWTLLHSEKIEVSAGRVWKTRLKFSLPVCVFWAFTFYIYLPTESYMGNANAFMVQYFTFIWPMALICLLFIVSYLILTLFFLTVNHYYICNNVCFAVTLLAHIQNMLLNGEMLNMDGTMQQWGMGQSLVNIVIWVISFVALGIISYCSRKKVRDIVKLTSYCGLGIQFVAVVILSVLTIPTLEFDNYVLTTEDTFVMAPQDNVVVFVLDSFDNQNIKQILDSDEDFLDPLDGFTYYSNTTGKYAFTNLGIPYLLTGVETEYIDSESENEYAKIANKKSTALEEIAQAGYSIGVYTEGAYISKNEYSLVENGRHAKRSLDIMSELEMMRKVSRYKTYPFVCKNLFYYSDDELMDCRRTDVEIHNVYNDVPFANMLLEQKVLIDESKTAYYKFYHLHGTHTSYNMNESFENVETDIVSQGKGSLNIVFEFIKQLKDIGLYEDTTIIITADHGQNFFDRPERAYELGMDIISCPIIFMKPSGNYGKELKESKAPVAQEDILPTVMEATCGNGEKYGRMLDDIRENEEREREFIFGRHNDIDFESYIINGDAMNIDNWTGPNAISEK